MINSSCKEVDFPILGLVGNKVFTQLTSPFLSLPPKSFRHCQVVVSIAFFSSLSLRHTQRKKKKTKRHFLAYLTKEKRGTPEKKTITEFGSN